jgi:hypothetical protein
MSRLNIGKKWCVLDPVDPNFKPRLSRLNVGDKWCYIEHRQAGIVCKASIPSEQPFHFESPNRLAHLKYACLLPLKQTLNLPLQLVASIIGTPRTTTYTRPPRLVPSRIALLNAMTNLMSGVLLMHPEHLLTQAPRPPHSSTTKYQKFVWTYQVHFLSIRPMNTPQSSYCQAS